MAKEVTSTLSLYAMDPITVSAQSDMDSSNLLLATYVQNGEVNKALSSISFCSWPVNIFVANRCICANWLCNLLLEDIL